MNSGAERSMAPGNRKEAQERDTLEQVVATRDT